MISLDLLKAATDSPYCPECGEVAAQGSGTHHFCPNHDEPVDFEWDPETGNYLRPKTFEPVINPKDSVF